MAVVALSLAGLVLLAFGSTGKDEADAAAAQRVALNWVGSELAHAPRRDGDGWEIETIEVNVVRSNRRILEVELDKQLRVTDTDGEDIGDE